MKKKLEKKVKDTSYSYDEVQLIIKIERLEAERDVYKKLYYEALAGGHSANYTFEMKGVGE